jgi:hypothetical protein
MRGIIVMGIGLLIAYWVDGSYFGSTYSRATGDVVEHVAASFKWK